MSPLISATVLFGHYHICLPNICSPPSLAGSYPHASPYLYPPHTGGKVLPFKKKGAPLIHDSLPAPHHHHHYSLGATEHSVQPEKEPVANAPLGTKPPSKIQKLNGPSKIRIFQIFPRRPLHEVSRTAAAEVEPTETSRRSSRRRLSDRTLPPPRSIRYQMKGHQILER